MSSPKNLSLTLLTKHTDQDGSFKDGNFVVSYQCVWDTVCLLSFFIVALNNILSNFKAQCYVGNAICQKKLSHVLSNVIFSPFNIYLEAVQWASCCGFAVFCHQIPRLCKVSDTQKIMSKEHNSQPYTFLHWDVKSNHYKPANQFLLQPYSVFTVKPIHFKAILEDCINK